jgi:hypothetical protein
VEPKTEGYEGHILDYSLGVITPLNDRLVPQLSVGKCLLEEVSNVKKGRLEGQVVLKCIFDALFTVDFHFIKVGLTQNFNLL